MSIDFHAPENAATYSGRVAGPEWAPAIAALGVPPAPRVADIGCGGGTYARAWAEMGAAQVVGVDASRPIAAKAAETCASIPGVGIRVGRAEATGLDAACVDVVFSRAVIHHLDDTEAVLREAFRIVVPGGRIILQDRTAEDVRQPPSRTHPRGLFFATHPRLIAIETARRPDRAAVCTALTAAGFRAVGTATLWETRAVHPDPGALGADLRARTGRSILHELSDAELAILVETVVASLPPGIPVIERDRWTLWHAVKPG